MYLNKKGFSLPEIIIAMGILAGISLVTVKLIENNANNQAHLKAKAEIQKAGALLKAILNNSDSCKNMLKDQVLPVDNAVTTPAVKVINPPALPAGSTTPTFPPDGGLYQRIYMPTTGTYAYKEILINNGDYGTFRIGQSGIVLKKVTDSNTVMEGTNNSIDSVNLIITFRMETKSILFKSDSNEANDATYIYTFPLTVTFDNTTNKIQSCGLIASDATMAAKKKFCASLGNMAFWDASNVCKLKETKCLTGMVPERQNTTVTDPNKLYNCVPATDQFNALDLFDTNPTGCTSASGKYTVVSDGGNPPKLKISCL